MQASASFLIDGLKQDGVELADESLERCQAQKALQLVCEGQACNVVLTDADFVFSLCSLGLR